MRNINDKKGIILFDMDDTLLQPHPNKQGGISIDRNNYVIDFIEDDVDKSNNITYGIDKRLLRYLETLKNDYLIATNTCWSIKDQRDFFDKTEFNNLFDYYCCGLYMHLYDNNAKQDVKSAFVSETAYHMQKYKDVKGLSHKVTEYFRYEYGDDFNIIQFEDIYNGSKHHDVSFTIGCLNIDDTKINPEETPKLIQEEIDRITKESKKYITLN